MVAVVKELALELLKNKLSRPAYKTYAEDEQLQRALYMDCLREADAHIKMHGTRIKDRVS